MPSRKMILRPQNTLLI